MITPEAQHSAEYAKIYAQDPDGLQVQSLDWPARGFPRPTSEEAVCWRKNTKGLFLARGNRFQAPQHIIIITRQEESPKAHKDRKPIISLQNRFLSYAVHNWETQMLRMLPYSNVKYMSN